MDEIENLNNSFFKEYIIDGKKIGWPTHLSIQHNNTISPLVYADYERPAYTYTTIEKNINDISGINEINRVELANIVQMMISEDPNAIKIAHSIISSLHFKKYAHIMLYFAGNHLTTTNSVSKVIFNNDVVKVYTAINNIYGRLYFPYSKFSNAIEDVIYKINKHKNIIKEYANIEIKESLENFQYMVNHTDLYMAYPDNEIDHKSIKFKSIKEKQ